MDKWIHRLPAQHSLHQHYPRISKRISKKKRYFLNLFRLFSCLNYERLWYGYYSNFVYDRLKHNCDCCSVHVYLKPCVLVWFDAKLLDQRWVESSQKLAWLQLNSNHNQYKFFEWYWGIQHYCKDKLQRKRVRRANSRSLYWPTQYSALFHFCYWVAICYPDWSFVGVYSAPNLWWWRQQCHSKLRDGRSVNIPSTQIEQTASAKRLDKPSAA